MFVKGKLIMQNNAYESILTLNILRRPNKMGLAKDGTPTLVTDRA